jgi:hypothetical protein
MGFPETGEKPAKGIEEDNEEVKEVEEEVKRQ